MLNDLRYGVRLLARSPGYAAVAAIALALGIGANSAYFAGIKAMLLEPLPFRELDRIVAVWETLPKLRTERGLVSAANFIDWRDQSKAFERMAAYRAGYGNLTGAGQPVRIQVYLVSPGFFPLLGMSPSLGRTLTAEEERPGADRVLVLSHRLWQSRFGGDPNIVGTRVALDGRSVAVAGVMPREFDFPLGTEAWAPLALADEERARRGFHNLMVLARLRQGITVAQARAEITGIAERLEQQYPLTNAGRGVLVAPLREEVVSKPTERFILVLQAAAGFVLLLACANVANLQLARMSGRHREIALRAALGASRWRIVRLYLLESVLVSLPGGALGALLAMWGLDAMKAGIPLELHRWIAGLRNLTVDAGVLGFTLGVALLAGVVSALVPALQASGRKALAAPNDALKEGARGSLSGSGGQRLRSLLVTSEVALALVLLVGAGLMVKTFRRMLTVNAGFNPEHLLTLRVALPASAYREGHQVTAFYDQALGRLRTLPEVQAAGATGSLGMAEGFLIEGRPAPEPGEPRPEVQPASPDYFRAMGIPLMNGRAISGQDGAEAPRVAVLSESVARHYWRESAAAIGRRIKLGGPGAPWLSVVGVVGDVKYWFTGERLPMVYLPHLQAPQRSMKLVLRTAGDPMRAVAGARRQVESVDPAQPVYDVKSMQQVLEEQTSGVRLAGVSMSAFAVMALVLAIAGIYGVVSYLAAQRTREIGLRMALGAGPGDVLRLVTGQALQPTLAGLAIGLLAAFGMARAMSSALFGVVGLDPATFAGFTLLLALAALLAAYIPARRATRVDPMAALRYE